MKKIIFHFSSSPAAHGNGVIKQAKNFSEIKSNKKDGTSVFMLRPLLRCLRFIDLGSNSLLSHRLDLTSSLFARNDTSMVFVFFYFFGHSSQAAGNIFLLIHSATIFYGARNLLIFMAEEKYLFTMMDAFLWD